MNENGYSLADIAAATGNNNGGFGNGEGWWIIILFALIFGWGRNGFAGNGGSDGGAYLGENYALITDNATLERKIDGVYSGICDSTFALNNTITNGFAAAQNTMTQGFAGLNTAIVTSGYETRNAITQDTIGNMQNTNLLSNAIKDCCCQTQQNIKDTQYAIATTGAGIQSQIKDCCCDLERQNMQTNFAMAQNNCATLQAIDKVGDRIIDYMSQQTAQALRDENQALRLAASQAMQNNTIINAIRPVPVPSFSVPNPYAYNNCGCGCGCN